MRRGIRRSALALAAAAALVVSAVSPAAAAGAGPAWPDGTYDVSLTSYATLPGAGTANVTGEFSLEIVDGYGSAPYEVVYLFSGVGVHGSGDITSGTMALHLRGTAVADSGIVTLVREESEVEWREVCMNTVCLDPRATPFGSATAVNPASGSDTMTVTGSSCGIVEGSWDGVVEDLLVGAAPGGVDLSAALDGLSTTFTAGSDRLGDYALWAGERETLLGDFSEVIAEAGRMPLPDQLQLIDEQLPDFYFDAAELRRELSTDYCPGYGTGDIGVAQAMRDLLFALLGNDLLDPEVLQVVLSYAMSAGAIPTGDGVLDATIEDRIVHFEADGAEDLSDRTRFVFDLAVRALGGGS